MATHTIELSDEEVANLKAIIEAAGYPYNKIIPRNPIGVIDNGPWLGQIYNKLPDTNAKPIMPPSELANVASKMTRSETCQFTHLHYVQAMLHARDLVRDMKTGFVPVERFEAVLEQLNEALGSNPLRSWNILATMKAVPTPKSWDQPFETISGDEIWYIRRTK